MLASSKNLNANERLSGDSQHLPQPLLILDDSGSVLVSNQAANRLLETNMAQLFEGISRGVGRTDEIVVGEQTFCRLPNICQMSGPSL